MGEMSNRVPAILRRWPRLRDPAVAGTVIPDAVTRYPLLEAELAVLAELVEPRLVAAERAAVAAQNRHRRQQVLILLLSLLVTVVAAVQAAVPDSAVPGALAAMLASVTAAVTGYVGGRRSLAGYRAHRERSESLRSLYFRYLTATSPFDGADRREQLTKAVAEHG